MKSQSRIQDNTQSVQAFEGQERPRRHSGFSNNSDLNHMYFVSDVQSWLEEQMLLIYRMEPQVKNQRINGVFDVIASASDDFQMGKDVDISRFPMSPMSIELPSIRGVVPSLRSSLLSFQMAVVSNQRPQSLLASAGSIYMESEGGSINTPATVLHSEESPTLAAIVAKVMTLSLPIVDQPGRYPVRDFGDRESVGKILEHCIQMDIRSPDQAAYILATAWHESRLGKWMTESAWLSESRAESYAEKNYGPNGNNPSRARRMGNTQAGDGGRYMGRGYVQLTWKDNYQRMSGLLMDNGFTYTENGVTYGDGKKGTKKIDLVANYRHVNKNKDLAARILVLGMNGGHFAGNGKGLDHHIPEDKKATQSNFENARGIVNGSDKKKHIANIAQVFAGILRAENTWKNAFVS